MTDYTIVPELREHVLKLNILLVVTFCSPT